jgi:multidrug efflux system membrane fusion protein
MPDPTPVPNPQTPAETSEPKATPARREWRKVAGGILSIVLVVLMILLVLCVWSIVERHPRTDDAIAMANVIGVAPRVSGQIIRVDVQDNQEVKAGDVLFEIDPADYQLALDNALAAQAALEQQIEVARAQDENLKYQVKAAEAGVAEGEARKKQAADTLARLQPLLPRGFATADDVDQAETALKVAEAALATQEQQLNQAKASLSSLATLQAQRAESSAAVDLARLHLSYCKVVAPFPGKVINLNLSAGAFASVGVPVFSLLDLRHWYVIANFREGELRHFSEGSPVDVYLMSAPDRHFNGTVQGIGWAVASKDEIDVSQGTPTVPRELNWVHIAQRFPVRIEVQNPDTGLFRMGASAVAIMR